MLAQTREQCRPVVLDPEVSFRLGELPQGTLAVFQRIRGHKVFIPIPFPVPTSDGVASDTALRVDPKEEVDGSLLVGI